MRLKNPEFSTRPGAAWRLALTVALLAGLALPGLSPSLASPVGQVTVGATLSVLAPAPETARGGGAFLPAADGQTLALGDQARTAAADGGAGLLTFFDGSELVLVGDAQVRLDPAPGGPGVSVAQVLGTTINRVQSSAGGTYQTDTATAVALVRGTTYVAAVRRFGAVAQAQPRPGAAPAAAGAGPMGSGAAAVLPSGPILAVTFPRQIPGMAYLLVGEAFYREGANLVQMRRWRDPADGATWETFDVLGPFTLTREALYLERGRLMRARGWSDPATGATWQTYDDLGPGEAPLVAAAQGVGPLLPPIPPCAPSDRECVAVFMLLADPDGHVGTLDVRPRPGLAPFQLTRLCEVGAAWETAAFKALLTPEACASLHRLVRGRSAEDARTVDQQAGEIALEAARALGLPNLPPLPGSAPGGIPQFGAESIQFIGPAAPGGASPEGEPSPTSTRVPPTATPEPTPTRTPVPIDNSEEEDDRRPEVTINQAPGQADPTNVQPIAFRVEFSERVTGFGASDVSLSGGCDGSPVVNVSGGPRVFTVTVSGIVGSCTVGASIPEGAARDEAGNLSQASRSRDNSITYDPTAPTVTVNQGGSQADPTNSSPITFTVTFGEPVTGFTGGDVSFTGSTAPGTLAASVSGGPSLYTVTVSGMTGSGTVVASVPSGSAQDQAGNLNTASTSTDNTVTYDVTAPTVTVNQDAEQADPTSNTTISFDVVFSESVTGFTDSDVSFAGSTAPGTLVAVVTGSGTTYDVTVSGMTNSGTVVVSVPANRAQDAVGNGNTASTSTDNSVQYDHFVGG